MTKEKSTDVVSFGYTEVDHRPLTDRAKRYAIASMSANTRRAYASQWGLWLKYAKVEGIPPLPSRPEDVSDWISARADAGQSLSTLRTAVAAVRAANRAKGHKFESRHPALDMVVSGISRESARVQRQVDPLRQTDVINMIRDMGSNAIAMRDAALFAIAYVFALRRSEVVGIDLSALGTGNSIVTITAELIKLVEVRGKTLKGGKSNERNVPRESSSLAFEIIERWISFAGISKGTPLLRQVNKSGRVGAKRISPQTVALVIKRRVYEHQRRLGVPSEAAREKAERFSGHSLRVGFAVSAAEAGAGAMHIMDAGGWASMNMPSHYTKKAEKEKNTPHRLPGVGLR